MRKIFQLLALGALGPLTSGCNAINQYASRVTTQNENASQASNEETLLNILRANDFKPINFLAITQVTAGGNESLSLGLPTFTFGPQQVAVQRQYIFGNNSISSTSGMNVQTNPLITADFIKGQTVPLPISNLAILFANFPREIVYYATIDRIKINFPSYSLNIINDPFNNDPPNGEDCVSHEDDLIESIFYSKANAPYCNFSKFKHIVSSLTNHGVIAELIPIPDKGSKDDSDSSKTVSPKFAGQFCHDQSLDTTPDSRSSALKACGSGKLFSETQGLSINKAGHKTEIIFRSPAKMYRYAGAVAISARPLVVNYKDNEAAPFSGERFVNIIKYDGSACDIVVSYSKEQWCVPSNGSRSTFAVFSMLQNLRNLSISSDDTNKGLVLSSVN